VARCAIEHSIQGEDGGILIWSVNCQPVRYEISDYLRLYTATVTQFPSFANGPLLADGFQGTSHINFGDRDSHWALDILNVSSASVGASYISPIPEPESYALLLAGLGLITFVIQSSSRKQMPV
jgi:hypothetical protein